ncbi:MAG: hypothetical protein PHN56_01750 [Candidatus Nanoarchaeia archaeon]|nr:hypothetical protein [Candidatus Nanoarchaeia archaeon]
MADTDKSSKPTFSLSDEDLANLMFKLKESKLLIKDGDKTKLDLGAFNKNLDNAAKNLGIIIPNVVEVSKEQVALINNGLEGVISFIKTFQTLNTSFAVFAERPIELMEYLGSSVEKNIKELEDLEGKIIKEVKGNITGLDEMLRETFKEVAVYYTALGHIIYSETEGGNIDFKYQRKSGELADRMKNIYQRKEIDNKNLSMERSLGLVQIIESITNIHKDVKKIKLEDKEFEEFYIKTTENVEIKMNMDVVSSLKDISFDLLNSLRKAGVLVQDQDKKVRIIEKAGLEERWELDKANKAIDQLEKQLSNHKQVTEFFVKNITEKQRLMNFNTTPERKVELLNEIYKSENQGEKAIEEHNKIVKNQMEIIIQVIKSFESVVALWGYQVKEEISIADIAKKSINAIDTLAKVEKKADIDAGILVDAKTTQLTIQKTCKEAEELTEVGQVMKIMLEQLRGLISYNRSLESQIRIFHSSINEAKQYKHEELKKIKKVLHEIYPKKNIDVVKAINSFNKNLEELNNKKNNQENQNFISNLITSNKFIEKSMDTSIENIKTEIIEISNNHSSETFKQSCIKLGLVLDNADNKIDYVFEHFNKLKQIFSDDFKNYRDLSKDYNNFVTSLIPMMEMMSYIVKTQKTLSEKKIELKTINVSLRVFTKLFDESKQDKEKQITSKLKTLMIKLKLINKDYYKDYIKKLEINKDFLNKLEGVVKEYFKDAEKETSEAYALALKWTSNYEVSFREHQNNLKELQVGFMDKLFNTSRNKENFWNELDKVNDSFSQMDKKLINLSQLNIEKPKDVKSFCANSVKIVNDMLGNYSTLIGDVVKIVEIMHVVNKNLSKLRTGKLETFEKMLQVFENTNKKLDEIENQTVDLEEYERINVSNMLDSIKKMTNFNKLEEITNKDLIALEKMKSIVTSKNVSIRNHLLVFYTTYLNQVNLPEKEKIKYAEINKEAKSKIE